MHELRVPDFKKPPIAMSQVLLASRGATRVVTLNVDPSLQGVLTAPPTTIRRFDQNDVLTVFAEIYDNRKDDAVPVRLTTTIADSSGRVVYRSEESVEAFGFEPERHSFRHHPAIPLKDLAPGDYMLRIVAEPQRGEEGAVSREVAFSVQAPPPAATH